MLFGNHQDTKIQNTNDIGTILKWAKFKTNILTNITEAQGKNSKKEEIKLNNGATYIDYTVELKAYYLLEPY